MVRTSPLYRYGGPARAVHSIFVSLALASLGLSACSSQPVPGPDKRGSYQVVGALEGAGAGMVTGAQVSAGTGPGAAIGAGFGAVVGAVQGLVADASEESKIKNEARLRSEEGRVKAQEVLAEHYQKRMEVHPGRDIYPADIFFHGDSAKMCPSGVAVVREIAHLNEFRLPYSRLIVASYAKVYGGETTTYSQHLTERRAREFVNQLVRAGVEPRRLETRAVVIDAPVLIDPKDDPTRYNQAIEIIALDR